MDYIVNLLFAVGVLAHTGYGNFSSKLQHREHKVHNIVLYPDKHSWCTTTAIVQVVGHPGCNSVKMDNNVCVGTCFSYIVPRTVPDTPGGDVLPYCDSCQPGRTTWKKVTLECIEGNYKNQTLTKYLEYIHDCNCDTCKDQSAQKLPTAEDLEADEYNLDSGLINDNFNVTDLSQNNSTNSTHSGLKIMISGLLKKLNNEDENVLENADVKGLHKNVWKNLLQKVESVDGSIDLNVFSQLVKSVEEESKIKFNYKRLKQALLKLKKYQDITNKENSKTEEIKVPLLSRFDLNNSAKEVLPKESKDLFASGLYSKLSYKFPSTGIENETVVPMIDAASQFLKPATNGSEISYHDNLEGTNHKVDKKDKLLIN